MRILKSLQISAAVGIASVVLMTVTIASLQIIDTNSALATQRINLAMRKITMMRNLSTDLNVDRQPRSIRQWQSLHQELTQLLNTIPTIAGDIQLLKVKIQNKNSVIGNLFDQTSRTHLEQFPLQSNGFIDHQLKLRIDAIASDLLTIDDMTIDHYLGQKLWLRVMVVFFSISLAIVTWTLLRILYTKVVGPIVKLEKSSAKIIDGQLDEVISTAGSDEIASLACSLETMRLSLLGQMRERDETRMLINAENDKLALRVEERTAQLAQSNDALKSFNYSVAHDLRAPLRGIDGWSLALMEDYADRLDEEGKKYLQRIRNDVQRMSQLIDDMLRLSMVSSSSLQKEPVDLSSMAAAIIGRLRERSPQRDLECIIQEQMQVSGDPKLLEIAMTNFLDNAWKFTGKNPYGKIEVGCVNVENEVVFFVRDNGVGFDMNTAQNLFAPFQRLHSEQDFPGTGIGLATAQRIVQRHGGRLWVEAQVGQGASFFFTMGGKTLTG